jgi:DNA topoisomerase I
LSHYLVHFEDGEKQSNDEINEIAKKIMDSHTPITTSQHIRNLKSKEKILADERCPLCGGRLVMKNGRYGKFISCMNYPGCKYIRK